MCARRSRGLGVRAIRGGMVAALSLVLGACASAGSGARPDWWSAKERELWDVPNILARHPDVMHRKLGFMHEGDGKLEQAAVEFRKAASFADKVSQAMLAEMHFEGRGVARDPSLAYAWMDLAAERGNPKFLVRRERIWTALDARQRQTALSRGRTLYAEYGDEITKPRIERILNRARQRLYLGSRGHSAGVAFVNLPGRDGFQWFPGRIYYDDRYWKPESYFAWSDELYGDPPRVDVKALRPLPGPTTPEE